MGTIAEKLTYLNETKNAIKEAIVNKGVSVNDSDTFRSYADKISSIEAGGGSGGDAELEASFISSIDDSLGANVTKLPSGITSIAGSAFVNCSNLALTELPKGITSIGGAAFSGCENLALTKLPSGLTTLKKNTFYGCENLALTKLPSGLTSIEAQAFMDCKKLALTELPEGLTSIGRYCFGSCTSLALTELPESLTSIDEYAFSGCSNMPLTKLPSSLTSIAKNVFYSCKKLALTELPEGLTSIDDSAFHSCTSLALTELPSSLTNITGYAFYGCSGLTSLNIKGQITTINSYLFANCSNLSTLVLSNITKVISLQSSAFYGTPIASKKGYIYVPDDLVESFKTASNWSTYANQIRPLSYLDLRSIEIESDNTINTYGNNKTMSIEVTYNGGEIHHVEQEGYTLLVSGNATLDGNVLTLNDNAQVGEIITITVTSTYDTSISSTKEIEVVYREPSIAINLNEGQWVDSGTNVDGNIVYQSDAGSFNINNGISKAILTVEGYTNVKLYIRSFAEGNFDYTEAFAIDTTAVRGKGLYKTSGKQSATDYIECIYELDGRTHTIEIMYSKDSSGNSGYDRGYFYIGECS